MSALSEKLLANTSKPPVRPALLVLEDGTAFPGTACGAPGEAFGEICFNTSLEGYLEVVTDPSYAGQIVTMTYPQIGNYGVNLADAQSEHPALRGLVVRDMCFTPSSWRSEMSLPDYLEREGVVAIEGIDTRALVRHVRDCGAMKAGLSTEDVDVPSLLAKVRASESIVGVNLAQTVSCPAPYAFRSQPFSPGENGFGLPPAESFSPGENGRGESSSRGESGRALPPDESNSRGESGCASRGGESSSRGENGFGLSPAESFSPGENGRAAAGKAFALAAPKPAWYHVVAYDCGAKRSILEELVRAGCEVTVVPWDTPAEEVLALEPDGVFLSNGPGDPDAVAGTYLQVEKLLGKLPVFGICLGHQMICKAAGARIEKLKYGHHGGNQPVVNLLTGRVEITAQNHGFNLVFPSLGPLVPSMSGFEDESENVSQTHPRIIECGQMPSFEDESEIRSPIHQRITEEGQAPTREDEPEVRSPAHPDDLRFWNERGIAPVVENSRYGKIRLTHVNLNDGTAEGIAFLDIPAFSVQYHPEANPGPTDSHYLFTAFTRLMDERADYLDIDIAQDRLQGWRF